MGIEGHPKLALVQESDRDCAEENGGGGIRSVPNVIPPSAQTNTPVATLNSVEENRDTRAHPHYSPFSRLIGEAFGTKFTQLPGLQREKVFTGTCYKCGQKGHSARYCENVKEDAVTEAGVDSK